MTDKTIENLFDGTITKDNCDYIAFVDASGDDGFKFGERNEGSSICYAVCMFVCHVNDIAYNLEVLDEIKKSIGCQSKHELKYTTMKRHRNSDAAHKLIKNLKGQVVSWVAFKKDLVNDTFFTDLSKKNLSKICHSFPISSLKNLYLESTNKKIYIAVDVMKKVEMDGLYNIITSNHQKFGYNTEEQAVISGYNLEFKDSKDINFKLIQIADIISGIIRTSFENYYLENFQTPNCNLCFNTHKSHIFRKTCKKKYPSKIRNDFKNLYLL
ncbi:DUF3800 domain-containing protein, partial [Clostridium perfringens]